ncbi:MAG: hypothetical protein IJ219_06395 [Bacteroidaceae bacterium]|nr:hypothetical protein [Bacteroidaceae bacterium]MBQ9170939.1 hypothetical protein [Bacteroidaceae bacterium]MBQ9294541.1 hypothetical protein [Bacteroidaceae bacterium]
MKTYKVLAVCLLAMLAQACQRETKDERFRREFRQFTEKECPKFVDACTRLDSAVFDIESRTLCYHYTVQDDLDDETIYTDKLISQHQGDILSGLRNSLQLKVYKDEGINFCYQYRSITTGKTLLELTFTQEDYGR